jgi:hypothetical protein
VGSEMCIRDRPPAPRPPPPAPPPAPARRAPPRPRATAPDKMGAPVPRYQDLIGATPMVDHQGC